MEGIVFDGQQTDEKILAVIRPHGFTLAFSFLKACLILVFFYAVLFSTATILPEASGQIRLWSTVLFILLLVGSLLWITTVFKKATTYITDRRIIRFELLSPIYTAKRALFWTEALKAKAYSTNLFWRLLKIGTVQVEPQAADHESVRVTDMYLFEDLANYLDKIIFTVKSNPESITSLRTFIPKPKGQRD